MRIRMDDGYLYLPHRDHFIIPVLCEKGDIQNAITSNHTNHNNNYDLITGGGAEIATKKKYRL